VTTTYERSTEVPPHDLTAEEAVLGSLLKHPSSIADVPQLQPHDFYSEQFAEIFSAMRALANRGEPIDYTMLSHELDGRNTDIGLHHLTAINLEVPSAAHIAHYGAIVEKLVRQRRLIGQAARVVERSWRTDADPKALAAEADRLADMAKPPEIAAAALATFTAAELVVKVLPEPRWAVAELIPEGLAVLAGRPKFGKSWMALQLALAIASGGRALSQIAVDAGDVLYLALEDNERRLQERLRLLLDGAAAPSRLHMRTDWPTLERGGAEAIDTWLQLHPSTRLVVIDTWAQIREAPRHGGDGYFDESRLARRLKELADRHRVAIVVLHHTRKPFLGGSLGDPLNEVLGSSGFTAAADTTLVLQREPGKSEAVLYVRGRDVKEQARALAWDDLTGWAIGGDAGEARLRAERREIIQLLREEAKPLTPGQVHELLGKGASACKMLLRKMWRDGELTNDRGVYGLLEWVSSTSFTGGDRGDCGDRGDRGDRSDRSSNGYAHAVTGEVTGNGVAQSRNGPPVTPVTAVTPVTPVTPVTTISWVCRLCGELLKEDDVGAGVHRACAERPPPRRW
jgi:hypothetical protein